MLFVVSGSSGVGKDTVITEVKKRIEGIKKLISCTTRAPRGTEVDGINYHYLTKEKFAEMYNNGEIAEKEEMFGNFYGTMTADIQMAIDSENIYMKDFGVIGVKNIKEKFGENSVTAIFIDAPMDVILQRLKNRETETEEQINTRISRYDFEHTFLDQYDYIVENDNLERCVNEVVNIILEKSKKNYKNGVKINGEQNRNFN